MNESNRVRSAPSWTLSARGLRSFFSCLFLSALAAAQDPRVVVSTTDDIPLGGGLPFVVTDTDLVAAGSGGVRPNFFEGHFQAAAGFTPTDIDAIARRPGTRPGHLGSLAFSLLSNEGGFLDGDVVVLAPGGGAALLISELDLVAAMGSPGANVDLDALAYDDQGALLFSVQTDLTGPLMVLDGDILRLDPGFTGVTKLLSESDVQARFSQATGLPDAILDVQALEWKDGDIWVAVQSPSSQDGAVIKVTGTPEIVVDETTMGLAGAEIDALCSVRPGDEIPAFHLSLVEALPGDSVHVEVFGPPNAVLMVLMSGNTGQVDFSRFPGFGAWYLDRLDPWFQAILASHAVAYAHLDANGRYATDWNLPGGLEAGLGLAGELGWSFQVMDVSNLELSAPFRIRRL